MTKDEALKMALEALERFLDNSPIVLKGSISGGLYEVIQCHDAITAIKEALSVTNDMTLRDCFAAKAMPLSYQFWMEDYYHPDKSDADMRAEEQRDDFDAGMKELIAESAYGMADAMLKARNA